MRSAAFSLSAVLLVLAASSVAAMGGMTIPAGAYCDTLSLGATVLVQKNSLLFQWPNADSVEMALYWYNFTGMGNVTLTRQSSSIDWIEDYIIMDAVTYDWATNSLNVITNYAGSAGTSGKSSLNMTAKACAAPTSNQLATGAYCSPYMSVSAAGKLILFASNTDSSMCGGTYDLSSTNYPVTYNVGAMADGSSCSQSLTTYMAWSKTSNALLIRGDISATIPGASSTLRMGVALTAGNCGANATTIPTGVAYCASSSAPSMWQKSVLAFSADGYFSWVPKPSGSECIRLGTYYSVGNVVDTLTFTDQCGSFSGVARPTGLIYDGTSFTTTDDQGNTFTMSQCANTADPMIPQGAFCGGASATLLVTGTSFMLRPDINSNSGTSQMDCLIAGTFGDQTGFASVTSMASTCANSVQMSSVFLGQSSTFAKDKAVWLTMNRGFPEGYTFSTGLCTANVSSVPSASYNLALPSGGPSGPMTIDTWGYMTMVLNGSWTSNMCWGGMNSYTPFFGGMLSQRGGKVSYVLNTSNTQCTNSYMWVYDVMIANGQLTMSISNSNSNSNPTANTVAATTTTAVAQPWDGIYCGMPGEVLIVSNQTYIWRDTTQVVVGGIWGSGVNVMTSVQGYSMSNINILNTTYTAATKLFTVSLAGGIFKSLSAAQCTGATWNTVSTASYCATNVFGSNNLVLQAAYNGFSLILNDGMNQCVWSGLIVAGTSGLATTMVQPTISSKCPSTFGIFSISLTATSASLVLYNGTNMVSVTAAVCAAPTKGVAAGMYCSAQLMVPSTTGGAASYASYYVLAGSNYVSFTTGPSTSVIISANYTLNADNTLTLGTFGPIKPSMIPNATLVTVGSTTGIVLSWFQQSTVWLTMGLCSNGNATYLNTVLAASTAASNGLNVKPIMVLDYDYYLIAFPNATNATAPWCFAYGAYSIGDSGITAQTSIWGCNFSVNSLQIDSTNTVTAMINYNGTMSTFSMAASGCSGTGGLNAGRMCSVQSLQSIYTCNGYFVNVAAYTNVSSLGTYGSFAVNTNGTLTATQLPPMTTQWTGGQPFQNNMPFNAQQPTLLLLQGNVAWASNVNNQMVQPMSSAYCAAAGTPNWNLINASMPASMTQIIPVGPYCGTRGLDMAETAMNMPWLAYVTFVSMPLNQFYFNFSSPDTISFSSGSSPSTCVMTGSFGAPSSNGEIPLGFQALSQAQFVCFDTKGAAVTRFETAMWSNGVLTLTGNTFKGTVATAFTWALGGGNCQPRLNAAQVILDTKPTLLTVQPYPLLQQGTFMAYPPMAVQTMVVIGDTYVISTSFNGMWGLTGGIYSNNSGTSIPLTLYQQGAIGGGFVPTNASDLAPDQAPRFTGSFSAGGTPWSLTTVMTYQGVSMSISGGAAAPGSSSSSSSSKTVIIAVIVVVVVVAVIAIALFLRKGSSGSTGSSGPTDYQQMQGSKV